MSMRQRHELKKISTMEDLKYAWRRSFSYMPLARTFIRAKLKETLIESRMKSDWCIHQPKIDVLRVDFSKAIISIRVRKHGHSRFEFAGIYLLQIVHDRSEDDLLCNYDVVNHFELFKFENGRFAITTVADDIGDLINLILKEMRSLSRLPIDDGFYDIIEDDDFDDIVEFVNALPCDGHNIESIELFKRSNNSYEIWSPTYFVQFKNGLGCSIEPIIDRKVDRWWRTDKSVMTICIKDSAIVQHPLLINDNLIAKSSTSKENVLKFSTHNSYAINFEADLMLSSLADLRVVPSSMPIYSMPPQIPGYNNHGSGMFYQGPANVPLNQMHDSLPMPMPYYFTSPVSIPRSTDLEIKSGILALSWIFQSTVDAVMLFKIGQYINKELSLLNKLTGELIGDRRVDERYDSYIVENSFISNVLRRVSDINIAEFREKAEEYVKNMYQPEER